MRKYYFLTLPVFFFFLFIAKSTTYAGGCCFALFESNPGIAGNEPATFRAGFTDPAKTYQSWLGYGEPPRLTHQNITVNISNPDTNDRCELDSDTTDEQGIVTGSCKSDNAGSIDIYFSVPGYNQIYQSWFSSVKQELTFHAPTEEAPIDPVRSSSPAHNAIDSEVKFDEQSTYDDATEDSDTTQTKIEGQDERLNPVQSLIRGIRNFVSRILYK